MAVTKEILIKDYSRAIHEGNDKEKNVDDEFFSYEEAQSFLCKIRDHELYGV